MLIRISISKHFYIMFSMWSVCTSYRYLYPDAVYALHVIMSEANSGSQHPLYLFRSDTKICAEWKKFLRIQRFLIILPQFSCIDARMCRQRFCIHPVLQYTGSYNPSLLIFPCYRTSSTKICFFLFYSLTLGIAIIFFSTIKNSLTDKMRWDMIRLKSILAALNATERRSICGIRI